MGVKEGRETGLAHVLSVVISPCSLVTLLSHRSIVYLEIDNRQCIQSSSQCFQSATDVAAFLGALASLGNLNIPYKIEAVKSKYSCSLEEETAKTCHPSPSLVICQLAAFEQFGFNNLTYIFFSFKSFPLKNCKPTLLFLLIPGFISKSLSL